MTSREQHEDDSFQLVDNDELDRNLQPHLTGMRNGTESGTSDRVSLDYINPALDDGNNDKHDAEDSVSSDRGLRGNSDTNNSVVSSASDRDVTVTSPPVYYSNRSGESTVIQEPVVIRQPNGVHVIRTQHCCELAPHRHRQPRPIKLKHIKLLKIFSIVAIVIFFPLGIPALFYAMKGEKEFHAGLLRGDLDMARKWCKRSERLIIFSVMAALLLAVAIFAIVERVVMEDDDEYWKNRSRGVVLPTG